MSNLLEQASLVMIPSGYKEDVVYSEIPLDGSGDMSFTRASNGTRINSQGLVEVTPWNLVGYSQDFSDAYWNKSNSPVMAYNVATAPNGTMTADSIQSNSASVYQSIGPSSFSIAPNSTFTLSLYIKKETSKTYFTGSYLYFTGGTTKLTYVLFDEVNGTINILAPDQVSMVTSVESVGDWWRFIVTGTDTGSNTNLDFAFYGTLSQNGTSLSPGIGSARTIWGAQLNIGSTAKPYFPTTDRLNVPRLTYQNGGGGCPSLLLEKQSTNEANYSQDFGNAYWSKGGATITANATTSPDGTQDADKIAENTTSTTTHYINKGFTLSATTYTLGVFAKASERKWIFLIATTSADVGAFFDLENGVVGNVSSGYSASIENFGNGWYRCNLTFTATAATWYINYLTATANNTYNYAGTIGSGIFVWGAQLEASSYPTSYIPTTSSSATRVLDECSKTGISSLIGQTEGVLFVDFQFQQYDGQPKWVAFLGGGASYIGIYTNSSSKFVCEISNSGANQFINDSYTFAINQRYKIALAYKANDFVLYINGTQVATDSSGTVPSTSQLSLQYNTTPDNLTSRTYNQVVVFPTRLTNAELASLTTI